MGVQVAMKMHQHFDNCEVCIPATIDREPCHMSGELCIASCSSASVTL